MLSTSYIVLQNIEWSTDKVLQQTLRQAEQLHLQVAPRDTLPTLQDIDTVEVSYGNDKLCDLMQNSTSKQLKKEYLNDSSIEERSQEVLRSDADLLKECAVSLSVPTACVTVQLVVCA